MADRVPEGEEQLPYIHDFHIHVDTQNLEELREAMAAESTERVRAEAPHRRSLSADMNLQNMFTKSDLHRCMKDHLREIQQYQNTDKKRPSRVSRDPSLHPKIPDRSKVSVTFFQLLSPELIVFSRQETIHFKV